MTVMRIVDTAERRRRLAMRHHLVRGVAGDDLVRVADELIGIHASDPASVYLGLVARTKAATHGAIAAALYEERSLLKVLGMRRTMFVVSRETAGIINSAVTHAIGGAERRRLVGWLAQAGVAEDAEKWLSDVEKQTVAALEQLGEATATELTRLVPGLRVKLAFGEGKRWAGQVGVSTRVLFLLAAEGRIIRGRPRGSWLSSMYAWAPMDRWVPGGLPHRPVHEAQAELVQRWLRTFGPGTLRDIQWWTGLPLMATRRALEHARATMVTLDEGEGYVLPDDLDATADSGPWVALLPALDTTTMGWQERTWFLGAHGVRLFDRNGNAGPTVWADGRIVGGWAQRADGEITYRLFEDVGREAEIAVGEETARLSAWLGESRVIPRFRTPHEKEAS